MASNGNGKSVEPVKQPRMAVLQVQQADEVAPEPMRALYKTGMRRFVLRRDHDVSGHSGTGIVAEGVEFSNGHCTLSWLTPYRTLTFFDNAKTLDHLHEHEGKTSIVWLDDEDGVPLPVGKDGYAIEPHDMLDAS